MKYKVELQLWGATLAGPVRWGDGLDYFLLRPRPRPSLLFFRCAHSSNLGLGSLSTYTIPSYINLRSLQRPNSQHDMKAQRRMSEVICVSAIAISIVNAATINPRRDSTQRPMSISNSENSTSHRPLVIWSVALMHPIYSLANP